MGMIAVVLLRVVVVRMAIRCVVTMLLLFVPVNPACFHSLHPFHPISFRIFVELVLISQYGEGGEGLEHFGEEGEYSFWQWWIIGSGIVIAAAPAAIGTTSTIGSSSLGTPPIGTIIPTIQTPVNTPTETTTRNAPILELSIVPRPMTKPTLHAPDHDPTSGPMTPLSHPRPGNQVRLLLPPHFPRPHLHHVRRAVRRRSGRRHQLGSGRGRMGYDNGQ